MAITDGNGFPVAVRVASASPHETRLVAATIEGSFTPHPPEKLIGDLAYDSDPLDETLKEDYGVELIAPHKSNRRNPRTQDGRALGALINTRGMMELVILNIGLEIKVISPALFSMMVMMALVTTFMTTPLLEWVCLKKQRQAEKQPAGDRQSVYRGGSAAF